MYLGYSPETDIQINKYEYIVGTATDLYNGSLDTFPCTYDRTVDVYVMGTKISETDYVATNGVSITLNIPRTAGEIVSINAYYAVQDLHADVINFDNAGTDLVSTTAGNAIDELGTVKANLTSPALVNPTINGYAQSGITGFKNKIINGGFDVWQRGTTGFTGAEYTADRWYAATSRAVVQSTAVPTTETFAYSAVITPTGVIPSLNQGIELPYTGNAGDFIVGKTFTLSFWARSGASHTNATLTTRFRDSVASVTNQVDDVVNATLGAISTVWTKYTHTFTVSASPVGTSTSYVLIIAGSDIGNNLFITGVQLEEGSVATAFEQRPIGMELSLCQRYYQRNTNGNDFINMYEDAGGGGIYRLWITLQTIMRTSPTVSTIAISGTAPTVDGVANWGFRASTSVLADANFAGYTADAEL